MPATANAPAPQGVKIPTAEDVIETVRAALGPLCRVVMVVSGVVDGEVSGVVIGDTQDDDYISSQELAAGVVYIVVGVGKLASTQPADPAPTTTKSNSSNAVSPHPCPRSRRDAPEQPRFARSIRPR